MTATAISRKGKTRAVMTRIKTTLNCCKKILSVKWKAHIQFIHIIRKMVH